MSWPCCGGRPSILLCPQLQATIPALAAATFDGSAIAFYLWNLLYFRASVTLALISGCWLLLAALLTVVTLPMLPSWRWLTEERARASARGPSATLPSAYAYVHGAQPERACPLPPSYATCGSRDSVCNRTNALQRCSAAPHGALS